MEDTLIKEFTPYPHTGWTVMQRSILAPLPAKTLVNDGEAGVGAHSVVYFAIDPATNIRYVVKAGNNDNAPEIHHLIADHQIAPRVYMQLKLRNKEAKKKLYLVVMDPIKMSLSKYFSSTLHFNVNHVLHGLKCLCEKKFLINFFHGDLHTQNIVFLMDGSLGVIDFEFARPEPLEIGALDLIPLITDLKLNYGPREQQLAQKMVQYVNYLFRAQFSLDRLQRRSTGGFEYKGKFKVFHSYGEEYEESDLKREFPKFQVPFIQE